MKTKTLILIAILAFVWTNGGSTLQAQDSLDLEIVWQKEVFPKEISDAKFSADGQWIYAAVGNTIEKISIETGEFLSSFDNLGISNVIGSIDISTLGNIMVTRELGLEVNLWDTNLEKVIKHISYTKTPNVDGVRAVALSPDEKRLVLSIYEYNSNNHSYIWYLVIYDIQFDNEIKRINGNNAYNYIKFSHDGKYFATGGFYDDKGDGKLYDQVILWSTETWEPVDTIETLAGSGSGYRVIKFSKDDKYLSCVRNTPYDGRIYDLILTQDIFNSDININCYNIELLPDNYHFFVYYYDIKKGDSLELHNYQNTLKSFDITAEITDSYNADGNWKILCTSTKFPLILMTKKPVEVEIQFPDNEKINISQIENQIIIETNNINNPDFNVELYNIKGNLVYSETIENINPNSKYNLALKLPSGMYICNIKAGEKIFSHKFVVAQ